MAEAKRKATYDDVLAAPEHQVAEILDGELILSPRPALPHANATTGLGAALHGRLHGPPGGPDRPGGWWILFEPELHLGEDVLVPDAAAWRHERMPHVPAAPWTDLVPDWLCETTSSSTAAIDRGRKLPIYARAGVKHLWLLDPVARTLEVLRLGDAGRWIVDAVHAGADVARAEPFTSLEIELARLWID